MAQTVKNLPAMQDTRVQSLGLENSLEKVIATHSSVLAWRIPWTEQPGGLQSMGSQRVGYNWITNTHTYTYTHKSQVTLAIHILTLNLRGLNHQRFLFHSSYMPFSEQLVALSHTYSIQGPRLISYLPSLWQESEESSSKKWYLFSHFIG